MDRVHVMQLVKAFGGGHLTRREFLQRATLALGSLATAQSLLAACAPTPERSTSEGPDASSATSSQTSEDGLLTSDVEYPDLDGERLMGYLARPTGEEAAPAIVVIQEWWGLNEHIKDVTRRFAGEGFVALAPDLYKGVVVSEPNEAQKLVMELDMAEAVREIQQAIAFLQEQPFVGGQAVGVVGFCMGGGLTLQTTLVDEEGVGAAVAFYGQPLAPSEAPEAKAPVLGLYGEEDRGFPASRVNAMGAALSEAGIENELHIYPGAGHAFFNDTRDSYNPEAAADAWQRTLAWFREWL